MLATHFFDSRDCGDLYVHTFYQRLSNELTEQIGQPNALQLMRDLNLIAKDSDPVAVCRSMSRKLWDELQAFEGLPYCASNAFENCTCDLSKKMQGFGTNFMGLNSSHHDVTGEILATDPLPIVSRAYYLIQQEEKQKQPPVLM